MNQAAQNLVFTLSVEPTGEPASQHGFHLGTDETIARQCAAREFHDRNRTGRPTCTVALIKAHKIVDVYDGAWSSQRQFS